MRNPEERPEPMDVLWILSPILFLVALVYSSVGLGGGSSYVTILYLFGIPLTQIPPVALFLNIIVTSVALIRFGGQGYFRPRLVIPFLVGSVPAAYIGARWRIEEQILSLVFGVILFLIALVLLFKKQEIQMKAPPAGKAWLGFSVSVGALFGLMAGVMGIGGGVFLGPILLLLGLASPKVVAATCSAFILVNSAVGLLSHAIQGRVEPSMLFILGIAVFLGGEVGSFLGTRKFPALWVQRIFAFLLLGVSLKLSVEAIL